MKTIRRIYFYAVALISMVVVLWGMIGLMRSIFSDSVGGGVDQLAQALALILVGVPVFGIHWWAAQRSTNKDEEERASTARAVFLYAALLGLFIPLTQNGLAFFNRLMINLFNIPSSRALIGGNQSLSDNFIAALMNGFVAAYFISILRGDWQKVVEKAALILTRRVYRYIWVLYSLIMSIIGVYQILRYLFSLATGFTSSDNYYNALFANGLALTIIGIPLWVWAWKVLQDSLTDPAERASLLRLGMLYILSLSGVIFVLSATGIVINELLQFLLKETSSFSKFFEAINSPLAIAIPLGAVWAYYGHWLKRDLATLPSAPRRAALRRLYYYILSLIGLVATFVGISMLLSFVIDMSFESNILGSNLKIRLADSLATLLVGLPLWLSTWRPMQSEALALDEAGEHTRRSIIRKIYLYLAIFTGVVGGMIAAVQLVSLILEALLDSAPSGFTKDLLDSLQWLILFGGLLAYHWQALRKDGMLRSEILREKADQFTALLFDSGDETLSSQLASLMEKESEEINLILQPLDEEIPFADAIILSEALALDPPEILKSWLPKFNGSKLILTSETDDWYWMRNLQEIKKSLRQLAEGEEISQSNKSPGWMIAVYILAGMMALQILFIFLTIVFDSF
ncbi:MAG: hypothetical protein HN736_13450 [Anaerolineae bacterium]|jgi:hypothetical protein|nr:hypothetical protein [Anaerolineae bacterium]MBT4843754.1 hypothetical protein [Anaerolineae bacterium]MBT6061876.1 hypothetical protein [Anaerolineae bacterium]MBT6323503.1 hypothetical protein [Anaerolineae bacterium]MBT6813615.1 hypothetical protein [Anaerolineae bacterium]